SLDADAWHTFVNELRTGRQPAPPQPPTASLSRASQFMPTRIAARVKSLKLTNREWSNVVVDAKHENASWQAVLASDEVAGKVSWQPGDLDAPGGRLRARLSKAAIPAAVGRDLLGQLTPSENERMPAIDLIVDDLKVREHEVGRLA